MINNPRRRSAFAGYASLAITSVILSDALAQPVPGGTLDPTTVPKYVQPLVIPPVMKNSGGANDYNIAVRQFQQQILPGGHWNALNGRTDPFPPTTVWSYGPAEDGLPDSSAFDGGAVGLAPATNSQFNYPAFTVEVTNGPDDMSGTPVTVDWINDLKENFGAGPKFLPHLLPVDQTLHWANPSADCIDGVPRTDCRGLAKQPYRGPVPIVTHVHGSHADPESDGYAEAWWLPDPTGSNFSCVADPADAVNGFYVCAGTLANGFGAGLENTNQPGHLGVGQFTYRNDQPSTTLWYHDHTLGMTRSNVYAGPAGFWIIRQNDGGEDGLVSGTLPGPAPAPGDDPNFDPDTRATIREIPIVIQDRSFNADGSLPDNRAFFEGVDQSLLNIGYIPQSDISPIWNPEAFFNTMVVNGTTWPVLDVAQAKYRFRLLNGCNSRFLIVKMNVVNADDGTLGAEIPFYQIGAEQSLLPNVVEVQGGLLMGLAERADVIVDFAGLPAGTRVRMSNIGPDEPFKGFPVAAPADPGTTGQVMEFVVDTALNGASPTDPGGAGPDATDPMQLVLNLPHANDPANGPGPGARTRDLALLEEESQQVCVQPKPNGQIKQIRSVKPGPTFFADCFAAGGEPFGPKAAVLGWQGSTNPTVTLWSDDVVTNPALNSTETWEFWNVSADAHPIHLHLVKFKVTGRGPDGTQPPAPTEAGWKDTVIALPGEVTRVKATFDIPGLYVWHCHIVEHEDNEMMVPYCVGPQDANGCQTQTFDPGA